MGRMYSIVISATAATTAVDFFEISPADDKPVALHAVHIGQTTEIGDAQEEMLRWTVRRGGTGITSGSGGSSVTPVRTASSADTASGATCEVMNTTVATFTGGVIVHDDAFNVRTGLLHVWTPETRPVVSQVNGGLVVRLESTPTDSITFVGTLYFEELV